MIGSTPLLAVHFTFRGRGRRLYAKAEHLNMTGSIKDRMAYYILSDAYRRGALKPGDPIVEATSGNTGISLAALGRALGHPVTIFMPDWMSRERVSLIRSLGAEIHPVSRDEGGFGGSIRLTEEPAPGCPLNQKGAAARLKKSNAGGLHCTSHGARFSICDQMRPRNTC